MFEAVEPGRARRLWRALCAAVALRRAHVLTHLQLARIAALAAVLGALGALAVPAAIARAFPCEPRALAPVIERQNPRYSIVSVPLACGALERRCTLAIYHDAGTWSWTCRP
jgi:hypothetical protein